MASKFLNLDGLTEYDALIKAFINSKIFVGTYAEYQTADVNGKIPVGALVILTDDATSGGESSSTSTSSKLGTGALGYMILG